MKDGAEDRTELSVPPHLAHGEVERVAREFTTVYHDLKQQTFGTTRWLDVPLVKPPTDMLVLQEIVAETRPELIVETGVYVGGSALLFASLLDLLEIDGKVMAMDIDLSAVHERVRAHPRIELIEGSSTDPRIVSQVRSAAHGKRVMVDLDSDHRAHHVLEELRTYGPLVTPGCYLVVEDGIFGGRPVRPDAVPGPSEALDAWFAEDELFEVDRWRERFLLTSNPRGFLRRKGGEEAARRQSSPQDYAIGLLELTKADGAAEVSTQPPPEGEPAAPIGEPDREVEALRRTVGNLARGDRQAHLEADRERRRHEVTVEGLLREIDTQQELLRERDRLLARERARLRRITESRPYAVYRRLRALPGVRSLVARRANRRRARLRMRGLRRGRARVEATERFVEHHRGQ